jgi:hypothetical protein
VCRLKGEEMPVLKNQLPLESCYYKVLRSVAIATDRSGLFIVVVVVVVVVVIIIIDLIILLSIYLLGNLHLS